MFNVKVTTLLTARFGHLALNTHLYVAQRVIDGPEKGIRRVFIGSDPCNQQLLDMWKRTLPLFTSRVVWGLFQYSWDLLQQLKLIEPLPDNIFKLGRGYVENSHQLVAKSGKVLSLTKQEEHQGAALLEKLGMEPNSWFICFQARDSYYHEKRVGQDRSDHRNCAIDTFLEAAELVTQRGGYAIRVGKDALDPLPETGNTRIIDYSSHYQSDFGDIFLLGKCRFLLGSGTGTAAIPPLFEKPVVITNRVLYTMETIGQRSLYIPKLIRDRATGKFLHFRDILKIVGGQKAMSESNKFADEAQTYTNDRHCLIDNTKHEILDACRDMLDQHDGLPVPEDARELQKTFKELFYGAIPDVIAYGPELSPRFALRHKDLIL